MKEGRKQFIVWVEKLFEYVTCFEKCYSLKLVQFFQSNKFEISPTFY
jgi:hypothetical protein